MKIENKENEFITMEKVLEETYRSFPNKTFVKYGDESFSWLDIEKASQIVANDLSIIGVKKDSHVGICCPNSINWIVTFFAICKLKATPVLLNPVSNAKEIATVVNVGDVEYLCYGSVQDGFDETTFFDEIIKENTTIKRFYSINSSINFKSRFNEYDKMSKLYKEFENYQSKVLLFTSGSTGVPKGVVHSISSILYRANVHVNTYGFTSEEKICIVLPLFHIFALYTGFFAGVVCNGTIVIPKNIKTSTIIEIVRKEECTNLNTVPTLMLALLANKDFKKEYFKTLTLTLIGGAASTPDQMKRFQEVMPNNHIANGYGLTEACPATQTQHTDSIVQKTKTVGKPYEGIEIKIVNHKTSTLCKNGEIGEVLVRGYCNMIGYYKAPKDDKTVTDDGWLHTGDLGYIDNDGYLCLSGRIKEIIIRGGENIMPLEISMAVEKNSKIKEAKVVGIPDSFRGEEVVACVTMNSNCEFDEEDTKSIMSKYISKNKMPKYFLVYNEFPKLSNGKIDLIKLKEETIKRISSNKNN